MITIDCPWCDEDVALSTNDLELEPAFTCPACATSVVFVEEPEATVAIAA
jgi:hypothetical protein